MNIKKTIQECNQKLDLCRRHLNIAQLTKNHDDIEKLTSEINQLTAKITNEKEKTHLQLSEKAQKIVNMNFHRVLSKSEQADMGKLKKSVRGIVFVHPTTALGKEMGVKEMTGYAFKPF